MDFGSVVRFVSNIDRDAVWDHCLSRTIHTWRKRGTKSRSFHFEISKKLKPRKAARVSKSLTSADEGKGEHRQS